MLANNYDKIEIENNLIWAKRSGKWGAFTFKGVNVIPSDWLSSIGFIKIFFGKSDIRNSTGYFENVYLIN
uniref:Uncharacterized protein n=1 Tax=uncultured Thiotrichaceae bacterium TaxID=298394 RepID=A0A6S6U5G5_9GAMM|nr:MAG: Unknown protein [uncultured Thiotrichaceae bacterium]